MNNQAYKTSFKYPVINRGHLFVYARGESASSTFNFHSSSDGIRWILFKFGRYILSKLLTPQN